MSFKETFNIRKCIKSHKMTSLSMAWVTFGRRCCTDRCNTVLVLEKAVVCIIKNKKMCEHVRLLLALYFHILFGT